MKIRSTKLTGFRVAADGAHVGLEFLDHADASVTVELSVDQLEALGLTIPHLLTRAMRRQTGDEDARYVFGLDGWSIESAAEHNCLLANLITSQGFAACFAIPLEACRSLAWNLQHAADEAGAVGNIHGTAAAADRAKAN